MCGKGLLNSEWIYEVIVSPKMHIKNYKDFCPTKEARIVAKKLPKLKKKITKNKPESFQPSKASQTFQYFEK